MPLDYPLSLGEVVSREGIRTYVPTAIDIEARLTPAKVAHESICFCECHVLPRVRRKRTCHDCPCTTLQHYDMRTYHVIRRTTIVIRQWMSHQRIS
jgi:hypothetical protein